MRAILFEAPRKIRLVDDAPKPRPATARSWCSAATWPCAGRTWAPTWATGAGPRASGRRPPGWLGHENIGTIVESRAPGWEPGTLVLAHPDDYNGFAEFIRSKPAGLARLPPMPPDPAALIVAQPLATVLRALVRTGPVINQRCAVVGPGPDGADLHAPAWAAWAPAR